jgi:hypothetical protein
MPSARSTRARGWRQVSDVQPRGALGLLGLFGRRQLHGRGAMRALGAHLERGVHLDHRFGQRRFAATAKQFGQRSAQRVAVAQPGHAVGHRVEAAAVLHVKHPRQANAIAPAQLALIIGAQHHVTLGELGAAAQGQGHVQRRADADLALDPADERVPALVAAEVGEDAPHEVGRRLDVDFGAEDSHRPSIARVVQCNFADCGGNPDSRSAARHVPCITAAKPHTWHGQRSRPTPAPVRQH